MRNKRRNRHPDEADDDAVFINTGQVCARYGGRSRMWFERLLRDDLEFPRPMYIRKIRYFKLADVIAWERKRAADSRAA